MTFPWKNVLFSTHTKATYMPPPRYGEKMLICGPAYPTQKAADGSISSVRTPLGQGYDIASLIAALPAEQKPDIIIARVDASMQNIPQNLAAAVVPKLAILGDSHHMRAPIARLVNYALSEPYDFYILDHNWQHAHWYLEAGLRNVVWIPALLLAKDFRLPVGNSMEEIIFIGQTGALHPHRTRLLRRIKAAGLPLTVDSVPQTLAAGRYNRSRITLNCSLNGDLNLRVFETMAAGGMLMTDRLSPTSGLYSLFTEGEHFVDYSSDGEFIEKAGYYLEHPAERNRIAKNGYRRVTQLMSMQARIRTLANLVDNKRIDPQFSIESDRRISAYGCHSKADLHYRIALYEWVQEQHRKFDDIRIINTAGGDLRILCDLADLPQLELFSVTSQASLELVKKSGLEDQIKFLAADNQPPADLGKTVAIVSAANFADCLKEYRPAALLFADMLALTGAELEPLIRSLHDEGFKTGDKFAGLAQRSGVWEQ
jgi:hypothetical protein